MCMENEILKFKIVLAGLKQSRFNEIIDFETKKTASKWSKKEILGHLIDSALHNWKRFAEISFSQKPYQIVDYYQNELVKSNDYQHKNRQELIDLWLQINNQILILMQMQNKNTLAFEIILANGERKNLLFVMKDYLHHLYHHLEQIKKDDFDNSK